MKKSRLIVLLLLVAMLFSACQNTPAATEAPTAVVEPTAVPVEPTKVPEPTAVPTEEPTEVVDTLPVLELITPTETLSYTMSDLKSLPATSGMGGIKSSTGKITAPLMFTGISLRDLAELAGGIDENMGINLIASDGYAIAYSFDQIMNGTYISYDPATGDELRNPPQLDAILAYEMEGEPLDTQRDGNLRLVIVSSDPNQVTDGHWSVKWVEKVEVRSVVQDWVLTIKGAIDAEIDRASFESCVGCHPVSWTDDKGQVWSGTELWRLMGYGDNAVKHEGFSYDVKLAKSGYDVTLIAADGFSATVNSDDADRNHEWVVAMLVDGAPLDEKNFPLKFVGVDLEKKQMVGALTTIQLGLEPLAEVAVEPEPAPAAAVDLTDAPLAIVGMVDQETGFTEESLRALNVVTINAEHPKNGPQDFEGVLLSELLALAGVKSGATKVVFIADDGFSTEVALADITATPNAMLGFTETVGKFKMVMPGLPSNTWVKGVVKIEVK